MDGIVIIRCLGGLMSYQHSDMSIQSQSNVNYAAVA